MSHTAGYLVILTYTTCTWHHINLVGEVNHIKEDLKLIYFNYPLYFPPFRMATMIAKEVVGSKVKSITKDI